MSEINWKLLITGEDDSVSGLPRRPSDESDGCLVIGLLGFMVLCVGGVAIDMGARTGGGALHWLWATASGSLQAMVLGH